MSSEPERDLPPQRRQPAQVPTWLRTAAAPRLAGQGPTQQSPAPIAEDRHALPRCAQRFDESTRNESASRAAIHIKGAFSTSIPIAASSKLFSTFVTLRLGSRVFERVALLGIGRGHQSAKLPPIPSSVRRMYTNCHETRTAGRGGRILPDGGLFHHVQQCHTTAVFQSMR